MYSWNNTYTGDTIRRVRLTAVCDRMYGGEFGGGGGSVHMDTRFHPRDVVFGVSVLKRKGKKTGSRSAAKR